MARLMRSRVCVWAPWVSSSVDCSSTGGESRSFIGIWDLENTIRPNFKNIGRLMSNSGRISRRQGEGREYGGRFPMPISAPRPAAPGSSYHPKHPHRPLRHACRPAQTAERHKWHAGGPRSRPVASSTVCVVQRPGDQGPGCARVQSAMAVIQYSSYIRVDKPPLRAAPGRSWAVAFLSGTRCIGSCIVMICISTKLGARQAAHRMRAPCHRWSHY